MFLQYCQGTVSESEPIHSAVQLAGMCRRSAGNLDWMPLVETILRTHSNSDDEKSMYAFINNGEHTAVIKRECISTSIGKIHINYLR